MELNFIYSDGGRSNYFKGEAGDCVVRAITHATGKIIKKFMMNYFKSIKITCLKRMISYLNK